MLSHQQKSRRSLECSHHVSLPAGHPLVHSLQILLIPCLHKVCTAFFLVKAFQPFLVTYLHTVLLETLLLWSWSLSALLKYYAYTYSFFDNISLADCKKQTAIYLIYSLDCLLRSLLLTTCSLIVQSSPTILQFLWLNGQNAVKNRMPELQHKQFRPSFSWKSRKKKRKTLKYENRKPTKCAGKIWREKTCVRAHLGQKWKNITFEL